MEPTNKSFVGRWFAKLGRKPAQGKTIIEYLPDADEIERSPVPRFAQTTLHVLVLSFISFAVWAIFSQLDQVVVAQGRLVNPMPNIVVQPLETSIIQSVNVRAGQIVKKGDILATLDATFIQADETQLRLRLSSLETQIQGLAQELAGENGPGKPAVSIDDQLQASLASERKANYKAQQRKMEETSARLRAALQTNQRDQKRILSRLMSLKEIETMQEKLVSQKFVSPMQLLEAQQRSKEVERDLELTAGREQELKRELGAFEAEALAFVKGWRQKTMEDLLAVSRERDTAKEQLQKADKRNKLVTLVAPADAVVLEIAKLSPGSIVKEAETFFTLVPLNVLLEVEVYIDSIDIGYIKSGHPVRLKMDAYPFQKHGTLDATVSSISEDAFRRDTAAKPGVDAYYLTRITLGQTVLKKMIENSRLLPGMTLTAEIIVGKRSVISYLAWPLTKGLDEAIREP